MPTYETAARNALSDAFVDALDGGTMVIETSGDVEVATLTFGSPAFGASASGVATANAITSDTSATGGTGAQVSLYTSGAAKWAELTFGTSGTEVVASTTTIGAGITVSCASFTYTTPAS